MYSQSQAYSQQSSYPQPTSQHPYHPQQQSFHPHVNGTTPSMNGNGPPPSNNPKILTKLLNAAPNRPMLPRLPTQPQQQQITTPTSATVPRQQMMGTNNGSSQPIPNAGGNEMRGPNMQMQRPPMMDQRAYMAYQQQNGIPQQNGYMNGHPSAGNPSGPSGGANHSQSQMIANQQYQQRQQQLQQQQMQQQQQRQQPPMYRPSNNQEYQGMNGPSTSYSHTQNPQLMHSSNPMMQQQQGQAQHQQQQQHHPQQNGGHPSMVNQGNMPHNSAMQSHYQQHPQAMMNGHANPNQGIPPQQQQQQQIMMNGISRSGHPSNQPQGQQNGQPPGYHQSQGMNQMRQQFPHQQQQQSQQQQQLHQHPNMNGIYPSQRQPQLPQQPMAGSSQSLQFQRTPSDMQGMSQGSFSSSSMSTSQPGYSGHPSMNNGQYPPNGFMNQPPKGKSMQITRQLLLLIHAKACLQRSMDNAGQNLTPCGVNHCKAMKAVWNHIQGCRQGSQCSFPHCVASLRILAHWKNCKNEECHVCKPIREGQKKNQNQLKAEHDYHEDIMASIVAVDEEIVYTKPWQREIGKDVKHHLICKLIKAIFPAPDPAAFHDHRIKDLVSYARRIEREIFEAANSKTEYLECLAMKIYKIQKELLEKRNVRIKIQHHKLVEQHGPEFALLKEEFEVEPCPEPPNLQNIAEFLELKQEDCFLNGYNYSESRPNQQQQSHFEQKPPLPTVKEEPLSPKPQTPVDVKPDIKVKKEPNPPEQAPEYYTVPPEELRKALINVWKHVDESEPAADFRIPVDRQIIHYYQYIKNPIDLTTIRRKIDSYAYKTPEDFAQDMWLMIDNAWDFNGKKTKIYKNASAILEIFTDLMDPLMKNFGYCCGHRYTFTALPLFCYGQASCTIPRNEEYYCYERSSSNYGVNVSEKYVYCVKCYTALPECGVNMNENPDIPPNYVAKDQFVKLKNDEIENEPFEHCKLCGRKWHRICANFSSKVFRDGFICKTCRETKQLPPPENKYTAKKLPHCELSRHLESRVNNFMLSKLGDDCKNEVVIRVLHSADKEVKTKPLIKEKYGVPESFPYRTKVVFAFEVINDVEICFFGLHVQEYGSECSAPNARRVYIAYLDSVHFFEPGKLRTDVYHELLLGYLDYARKLGYTMAHLWACPPSEGDDYIFHCHPPEQKIPKQKRLGNWYKAMLDKGITENLVVEYKDIHAQAKDDKIKNPSQLPYFEGDFWPNVIEDCIKDVEKKNGGKDSQDSNFGDDSGSSKKGSTSMKKSASSKKLKSSNVDSVMDKLFGHLERHKDVFFTIKLVTTPEWSSQPIKDPDSLITCELMDGRDNFLTKAREEHWEFSSLRRAKYATLCLCHSLHSTDSNLENYTCNYCQDTAIWHCDTCEDFDLCNKCHATNQHEHKLSKVQNLISDKSSDTTKEDVVKRYVNILVHASQCRDVNCRRPTCTRIKSVLSHIKTCKKCHICKQMFALCCQHAKMCSKSPCNVPFCLNIRQKLQEQRRLQSRRAEKLMRRRMMFVQSDSPPQQSSSQSQSMMHHAGT